MMVLLKGVSLVGVIILRVLSTYDNTGCFIIVLLFTLWFITSSCQVRGSLTMYDPPMRLLSVTAVLWPSACRRHIILEWLRLVVTP